MVALEEKSQDQQSDQYSASWKTWMSVPSFKIIHAIVVEIFQSGPKWLPTNPKKICGLFKTSMCGTL